MLRLQLAEARGRYNAILAALIVEEERVRRRRRQRRRWWIRPWLERRLMYDQYETLMVELEMEHEADFKSFLRIEPQMFHELLQRVGPRIEKSEKQRAPLKPGLMLAITLRFLATGNTYQSLEFDFRVAHNTISVFVPQVCRAILEEYRDEVFRTPRAPDEWRPVAQRFQDRWNFPHCCGTIDGKHIAIKKPSQTGTLYYNYKGFFSMVLLGVVDADYKFIWADVGANGSSSDAGVFNQSVLEPALREGRIGFPPPDPMPNDDRDTPYFIVADDAFPLRSYCVKPFSKRYMDTEERIFNYRCSRARRVVENAFGILANRFRCLLTTLNTKPAATVWTVTGCLALHNIMRMRYLYLQNADLDVESHNHSVIPGAWKDGAVMQEVETAGRGPRQTAEGKRLRHYLMKYFNSPAGSVPWQDAAIDMQIIGQC